MDTPQKNNVTVIPTGAALGADVVGVDLSKPLSEETFRQIEDAWHTHLVLRFRGQKLDDPALLAFGQRFGELDAAPIHAGKDVVNPFPQITVMSNIKVDGKPGRNIKEADAMKHIFGYMIANDVSAREVQRQHGQQWFKGKSLDGHCPMGPWLTTADEVKNPQNLRITCRVNGVTKQDSNTSYMYFKIPRLLAELSAGLTLESGDLFLTGTPAGVGHARNPPEFMKAGDILETEVEGLGLLRNKIGAK